LASSRRMFSDSVKSVNADLDIYGKLLRGVDFKVAKSFLSSNSFRARRERAAIIRAVRAINKETRESKQSNSMAASMMDNAELYKNNEQKIITQMEKLKEVLGGDAEIRADLRMLVTRIRQELRVREQLVDDARGVLNEYRHLNDLIANPHLINERTILIFTREKLHKLRELENKYNKDSQINFAQFEHMITENENLAKKVDQKYGHRQSLQEMMGRLDERSKTESEAGTVYQRTRKSELYVR